VAKVISARCEAERVEVRRLVPEDSCCSDMLVQIRGKGRSAPVPLSQLTPLDADESAAEAIGDWHYRVAQGYGF
jgi:hypothetical protein